jgi:hypothetical protein
MPAKPICGFSNGLFSYRAGHKSSFVSTLAVKLMSFAPLSATAMTLTRDAFDATPVSPELFLADPVGDGKLLFLVSTHIQSGKSLAFRG